MELLKRARTWLEHQLRAEQEKLSSWKRLLLRQLRLNVFVVREIFTGEYLVRAGALVFATMLAIVPVATVSFTFFRAFGGLRSSGQQEHVAEKLGQYIFGKAPQVVDTSDGAGQRPDRGTAGDAADKGAAPQAEQEKEKLDRMFSHLWTQRVRDMVFSLVDKASGQTNVLSALLLILSAVLLFNTVETAFNRIWRIDRRRSFWVKFPAFFTILILGPLLIGASLWLTARMDPARYVTALPQWLQLSLLRIVAISPTALAFFIGYSLLPYTRVRIIPAATAAVVTAIVWEIGKWGFGIYVQRAVSYSRIYGPLAAFPIFLLWLYMTWIIVLFGAGLAYVSQNIGRLTELERQKALPNPISERLALSIMLTVARRFVLGRPPMSVQEMSEALASRFEQVDQTARELTNHGLLARMEANGGARLAPGRALDMISVADVIDTAAQANQALCRPPDERQRNEMQLLFEAINVHRDEIARDIPLRELVNRTLSHEEKEGPR